MVSPVRYRSVDEETLRDTYEFLKLPLPHATDHLVFIDCRESDDIESFVEEAVSFVLAGATLCIDLQAAQQVRLRASSLSVDGISFFAKAGPNIL